MSIALSMVLVLLVFAGSGCGSTGPDEGAKAGMRILDEMAKEGTQDQVMLGGGTTLSLTFRTGRLGDGIVIVFDMPEGVAAVVNAEDGAFWVKDDQTYTVNGTDRSLLPKHPQAPPEISYEAVDAVAE